MIRLITLAVEHISHDADALLATGRNGRKSDIFCFDRCRHKCSPTPTHSTGRTSRAASGRSKHMSETVHTTRLTHRTPACNNLQPARRIARRGRAAVENRRPTPTSKGLYAAVWARQTPDIDMSMQDCALHAAATRSLKLVDRASRPTGNAVCGEVAA